MFGVYTDLKSLVTSCLDDNPRNRPLVAQVLLEIKQVKDTYDDMVYAEIPTTDEQLSTQVQDQQQQQPQKQDQEQQQTQVSQLHVSTFIRIAIVAV